VINRQDQPVEDHSVHDPRRAGRHAGRVLLPLRLDGADGSLRLAWEAAESKQRVAMAVDHWISAEGQPFETLVAEDDSSVRYVLAIERTASLSAWRRPSATWPPVLLTPKTPPVRASSRKPKRPGVLR
jgi:hypothetical protein